MTIPEPPRRRFVISVRGVVQGVGFRPFIHRAASERALAGWIRNEADGVRIEVEGDPEDLAAFVEHMQCANPAGSMVTTIEIDEAPLGDDSGFMILESRGGAAPRAALPPDSAPCAECLREIGDETDRRRRYPFTNCTRCGPRFTITTALPYDRERTTMRAFSLCEECARALDRGDAPVLTIASSPARRRRAPPGLYERKPLERASVHRRSRGCRAARGDRRYRAGP